MSNTVPSSPAITSPAHRWALRLAALAAAGVVVLVGTATLAAFFGRRGWRWELLTHFRVQYFWALTLAAVVLAALRHRRLALVPLALAAVNLALIVPLYFGPGVPKSGASARALSLNIHFRNHDHLPTVELIGREAPDIVLIVELTPEWVAALKPIELEYPHTKLLPRNNSAGIGIYSRRPFDEITIRDLPGSLLPVIVARVTLEAGSLTFIGAHTASPVRRAFFAYRNDEMAEIARLAAAVQGPVVLMGDLNCTSWSPYFGDLLRVSGLRDSRYGFGVEGSWPSLPLPLRIPIDHCLVSPELGIVHRRIGRAVGSDHRPVIVDFTIGTK